MVGMSTGFFPGVKTMSSRASTDPVCTTPAIETSDTRDVTRTRRPAVVAATVDEAELAPIVIAPGVPASSEAFAPVVGRELPAAPAAAPAPSGVTTNGPDPIGCPLAVAVSCGRRG